MAGMLSAGTSSVVEPLAGMLSADVVVVRDASFSSIAAHSFL